MSRYVSDTHALLWHVTGDPKLSPLAFRMLANADHGIDQVLVPGIVLVETVYLVERGRLSVDLLERLLSLLVNERGGYVLAPLDEETARAMRHVPRAAVPDMPDRIIVATALQLGLPLITRDGAIHRAGIVPVIW